MYISFPALQETFDKTTHEGIHIVDNLIESCVLRPRPLTLMELGVLGYALRTEWHQTIL